MLNCNVQSHLLNVVKSVFVKRIILNFYQYMKNVIIFFFFIFCVHLNDCKTMFSIYMIMVVFIHQCSISCIIILHTFIECCIGLYSF